MIVDFIGSLSIVVVKNFRFTQNGGLPRFLTPKKLFVVQFVVFEAFFLTFLINKPEFTGIISPTASLWGLES